jgi:hypothetical protein
MNMHGMGCVLYIRCALPIHQKECRKSLGCALYIGVCYLLENTVYFKVFCNTCYFSSDMTLLSFQWMLKHIFMYFFYNKIQCFIPVVKHLQLPWYSHCFFASRNRCSAEYHSTLHLFFMTD